MAAPMTPAVPSVGPRVSGLNATAVNDILAEVRRVRDGGASVVSLMRGEPDFRTPAHIAEAAARSLAEGRTAYPDNRGEPALREAIAAKLARDNGLAYDPGSEVLVTTGATLGIHAALTALVGDGDEVLLPDPIYDAYQSPVRLAGGRVRSVPSAIVDGRFVLTPDALESAVTPAARVLLLNSPWNPTGTVFREPELRAIGEFVVRHDLALVSDEIYEAIVYDGRRHLSPASLSGELRARTVVVNSLSKTYAMTGWRVGYCAGPPPLVEAMLLVLQQSSRGPATFIQDAAVVALASPQTAVEDMRLEYARRRDLVANGLGGLPGISVLLPEGGFFAMIDVRARGLPSDEIRRRLLHRHGVAVVHGAAYGARGEGTLRVSFGSGGETLARGLERLRAGLAGL
jgi:aspartate/methionine/tyrosine aminotransferase